MNYETSTDWSKARETCLRGHVDTSYERLRSLFGEPDGWDQYKTSTHWIILFEDGMVATIYDYKDTTLYSPDELSPKALRALKSYDWHIGGTADSVVDRIQELVTGERLCQNISM